MVSVVIISKDEPALAQTLAAVGAQARDLGEPAEVVVIDASRGRLAALAARHHDVRWVDFDPPPGVRISIPHQRNLGIRTARGELVVFTDAGCVPHAGWLRRLVATVREGGEDAAAGLAVAPAGTRSHYGLEVERIRSAEYLDEAPTINLALTRRALDAVGGFDERFEYGSDLDFTWRLVDQGFRIRAVPDAVVEHDWGRADRQLRRAFRYGRAKSRLYRKHAERRRQSWRRDPVTVVYPLFLLALPLTFAVPPYPLLLLIPAWRNRRLGAGSVVADHLAFGAGVLSACVEGRGFTRRAASPQRW